MDRGKEREGKGERDMLVQLSMMDEEKSCTVGKHRLI